MHISTAFDSGNIKVLSCEDNNNIRLKIVKDAHSDFYQWFHFKLHCESYEEYSFQIENLAKSAYPKGWEDYQVLVSYDRDTWFRQATEFDGETLRFSFTPECNSVYFAYFIPYSYERHLDFVGMVQTQFDCKEILLGETFDGRELNLLQIGHQDEQNSKRSIWITARQHPGETMAQWLVEGLVLRLIDEHDAIARALLDSSVFYVVPNMNPDGGARGHLRTNALGVNLNREWQSPSLEKSPEVYYVLEKMKETGVDAYIDVHGDEALPYNFVAGCEGNPNYDDRMQDLETAFKSALIAITPEFQDVHGYAKDKPGQANLTIASNAVGHQFDCLAFTLEMPFKDNADLPDEAFGWSVPRCKQLGRDLLVALNSVNAKLRT